MIGRGGMGEVYRATDVVLGREVAVKVMLPVPETLAAGERFLREARASARLRHPHVVAAYDFGQYGAGLLLGNGACTRPNGRPRAQAARSAPG